MEVSVGHKACKRGSLGTEIIPLAQGSDHSNTTDFTPRQLWSHIRAPEFTWQGWKVGQFLQNLMLRVKPSSVSEVGRLGCSTGDRSLFIYAEKNWKSQKKNHYCVPPQGHIYKSCWNNFGRDSQVVRQKLPLFHNTSPKVLAIKRNADVEAEKNHCCKSLARAWASWLRGQLWQWLCLASSATSTHPSLHHLPLGWHKHFSSCMTCILPTQKQQAGSSLSKQLLPVATLVQEFPVWSQKKHSSQSFAATAWPDCRNRPQNHLSVWQNVFPPHLVPISIICCDYMSLFFQQTREFPGKKSYNLNAGKAS